MEKKSSLSDELRKSLSRNSGGKTSGEDGKPIRAEGETLQPDETNTNTETILRLPDRFLKFLVGNTPPYQGRIYTLDHPVFTIGREEGKDLDLCNIMISRHHAQIKRIENDFFIVDGASSNGTFVNNKLIIPHTDYKLSHKDVLKFDVHEFIYIDGERQPDLWETLKPFSLAGSQLITFFSPKGGTGITGIVMNLAYDIALASQKKVVVADFNMRFGDVMTFSGKKFRGNFFDLVENPNIDKSTIDDSLFPFENFKILASPRRPENADLVRFEHVQKTILALRGNYDFVLVDLKNEIDDITLSVWEASTSIYLVTLPELGHIAATQTVIDIMRKLKIPASKVKVIVNKMGRPRTFSEDEIRKWLGKEVYFFPFAPEEAISTTQEHQLYSKDSPQSALSKALGHLTNIITGEEVEHEQVDLLSKFRAMIDVLMGTGKKSK